MMRGLYRLVLWLHPPSFRRRYADEMLWIYDSSAAEGETALLLQDAGVSLFRQWVLRSKLWIIVAALAGAYGTILSASAFMHFTFRRMVLIQGRVPQELFVVGTAVALMLVAFSVIVAVLPLVRPRRRRA